MVSVSPVVWGGVAFVAVCGVLVVAAALVTWRRIRRRWRSLTSHAGVRAAVAVVRLVQAGAGHGDRRGARLRYQLWQGVWAATRAVRGAEGAGGATADLPSLCRRLRASAAEVDQLLVMAGGLRPDDARLRSQVEEVLEASRSIRLAALSSASDAASTRLNALVADANREVRALAAGLERSNSVLTID